MLIEEEDDLEAVEKKERKELKMEQKELKEEQKELQKEKAELKEEQHIIQELDEKYSITKYIEQALRRSYFPRSACFLFPIQFIVLPL